MKKMMSDTHTVECPVCKGTGGLEMPLSSKVKEKRYATEKLLEAGFGVRQITRLLGYKNANSVMQIKKSMQLSTTKHNTSKE